MLEIHHNSMLRDARELSGSNEVFEMPEAPPPVSHESKPGLASHVMVQKRTADMWKILFPKKIPMRSWISIASSNGAPCVETAISASAPGKELNMDEASIITSNLEAEIFSLYLRGPLEMNKSLPPTPISESPQISPALEVSNVGSSTYQRSQTFKVLIRGSGSDFISP